MEQTVICQQQVIANFYTDVSNVPMRYVKRTNRMS